jgi:hypothetical protein
MYLLLTHLQTHLEKLKPFVTPEVGGCPRVSSLGRLYICMSNAFDHMFRP